MPVLTAGHRSDTAGVMAGEVAPRECKNKFAELLVHERWNKSNAKLQEAELELHKRDMRGAGATPQKRGDRTQREENVIKNKYKTVWGEVLKRTR